MSARAPSTPLSPPRRRERLRVPLALVVLYWSAFLAIGWLDISMFPRFLARMSFLLLVLLALTAWWLVRGPFPLRHRFLVLGWVLLCGLVTTLLLHRSVLPPSVYVFAVPAVFTVGTIWLAVSRAATEKFRLAGMLLAVALAWLPSTFVRMEGLTGSGAADFRWRWTASAEERLLQRDRAQVPLTAGETPGEPLVRSAEDWVGFRGEQRDATVSGVQIGTDWARTPPRLLWRTPVGPAWSSMVVVGRQLFTQEQRGDQEIVSCFDAETGSPLWVHADPGRFEENLGGVGPRATPTFAEGRIYALGAAGKLNCLDAVTGQRVWSRDLVADAAARLPVWGFSGSPAVVENRVIVFAGGEKQQALLAYDAGSGDVAWKVEAGTESYTSPQPLTLDGHPQVLFIGNERLAAFAPESGKQLWTYEPPQRSGRPVIQPRRVGEADLLVSFSPDAGLTRLAVERQGEAWNITETWSSRGIKPDYSDLVHHDGFIYGFDGDIFCCLDLQTGKRQWKSGRYGSGQVLLLADQPLLLVITESGEVILLEVNPQRHQELTRFPAIDGKTWNHPVIARGRLYVRNAEEMACFELPLGI